MSDLPHPPEPKFPPPDDRKQASRRNRHIREEDTHGHPVQTPEPADTDEIEPSEA